MKEFFAALEDRGWSITLRPLAEGWHATITEAPKTGLAIPIPWHGQGETPLGALERARQKMNEHNAKLTKQFCSVCRFEHGLEIVHLHE